VRRLEGRPEEAQRSAMEVPANPGTSGNLQEIGQNFQASNPRKT
jgi:hypothetical protein